MVQIVSDFFRISGLDIVPPATLADLIPYLLQVIVAVVLVLAVFKTISTIAQIFCNWRWLK